MRIPVPRNRLVALTVLGMVLTGGLGLALASPSLLPGDDGPPAQPNASSASLGADAPTPNPDFTPAVQSQPAGGDDHEEYEDHEYGEEEHEEDEYREVEYEDDD